ncbi:GIY-YIG nuclease family protein [Arenibacter sp. M-2]|uniref:GIY-YIG nuclease family protein n=1 Tax=unclassified Arenibacter TaxID=2615047 RepID=UPI000D775AB7|nr:MULTISPECIES: GIY-YIG nuclease family protein [unclassified Arenibacter]MDL5514612.1 GIY-YIG nuclease family protein [Arenibacter sp. M-2]
MEYIVYILFSETADRYNVGETNNIEKRIATHNSGGKKYTSKGRPWNFIKTYSCTDRIEAVQ